MPTPSTTSSGGSRHSTAAPTRIDLAGGTLDIWPICLIEPDAVTVNLAIDRTARATARRRDDGRFVIGSRDLGETQTFEGAAELRERAAYPLLREVALYAAPERGLELVTTSGVPAGSGLGGSSTLFVAALQAALLATGKRLSNQAFLRTVIDLEARLIGVPTGSQDYVPAMHGGLSELRYPAGGTKRRAIRADLAAVARRLVLVYTGLPHDSATNNWEITQRYLGGDRDVRKHMGSIAAAARRLAAALRTGDFDAAGEAVAAEWAARKQLAPGVTTPAIERLGEVAHEAGATAHKVCGAGGGGCVFFWCAHGRKAAVTRAVAAAGADVLRFRPAATGARA